MKRFLIGSAAFTVGFALITVLLILTGAPTPPVRSLPLIQITYTGGLCETGECSESFTVLTSGKTTPQTENKNITREQAEQLQSLIEETNFDTITPLPPTQYVCASAYDGQDVSVVFYDRSDKDFVLCQYDLSLYPVLEFVNELYG